MVVTALDEALEERLWIRLLRPLFFGLTGNRKVSVNTTKKTVRNQLDQNRQSANFNHKEFVGGFVPATYASNIKASWPLDAVTEPNTFT